MKRNGIELTKEEELNYHKEELKEFNKKYDISQDHRKQASLLDWIKYHNTNINILKREIKINKLQTKQDLVRSNWEFDKINNQIERLKKEIDNIRNR